MSRIQELTTKVFGDKHPLEDIDDDPVVVDLGAPPDMVVDFGTTATVVALVIVNQPFGGKTTVALKFLAGEQEHVSDLYMHQGIVVAVGDEAREMRKKREPGTFHTSLKRYLELSSRGGPNMMEAQYDDIVSEYLQKSIETKYKAFGKPVVPGSRIVISIPNSFNPEAVQLVQKGVIRALNQLNDDGGVTDANRLTESSVRIVRESEAIAYLYLRRDQVNGAPVRGDGTVQPFDWGDDSSQDSLEEAHAKRIAVLDIGGGTTDLSLIDVDSEPSGGIRLNIRMNGGVPLGGSDVDKLLLRSVLKDVLTPDALKLKTVDEWHDLLERIRSEKEHPGVFFPASDTKDDPLLERLRYYIDQLSLPADTLAFVNSDIFPNAPEKYIGEFREKVNERISLLSALSVQGLFNLIPQAERAAIKTILLTGRASQLPQLQDAVRSLAKDLKAEVRTLSDAYHLKLAVAYGCALIRDREFGGSFLPSGTVGRYLSVFYGGKPVVEVSGDLPVSGDAPTLWQFTCQAPERDADHYELWEYKTFVTQDTLRGIPTSEVEIGCSRLVASWDVAAQGIVQGPVRVLIAWHPAVDSYFKVDRGKWQGDHRRGLDPSVINAVTGLPLGFPL